MKSEKLFLPHELLSHFIEVYSVRFVDPKHPAIIPSSKEHLLNIVVQGGIEIQDSKAQTTRLNAGDTIVVGNQTKHNAFMIFNQQFVMVTVRFKPWGITLLSGDSLSNFGDRFIDGALVFTPEVKNLAEKLSNSDIQDYPNILNQFFLKHYRDKLLTEPSLVKYFESGNSVATKRVVEMATDLCMSVRTLERKFNDLIGVSPKMYLRKQRFNELFKTLSDAQQPDWAQLTFDHGFYDQAHMIKEFKHYTSQTPTEFLNVTKHVKPLTH